ncbi:MAG: HDOD domain-containing protein [Cellvibrionaceae bacterium]|nr:HDOD domain-containing protein [Cellvibrionaceae bacterium]
MPVLGDVISELNKITGDAEADTNQLAEVILRDPHLTSHVLRIANSVQYNYSRQTINTVSRAIVLIGLKGMRAICISVLVIDSLMDGKPKEHLLKLMAQGFHGATQARRLVSKLDAQAGEEVFIAALLFNLGEMAFWSTEELDPKNEALMSDNPATRKAAIEEVLGTSFKAITRELAKHWKLGETLESALYPEENPSEKVKAVITGERLSRAALYGWDSPQVQKVVGEVATLLNLEVDDAINQIKVSADEAAQVALNYGVSELCPLIPSSIRVDTKQRRKPPNKIMKGDTHLQLTLLRELSATASDNINVNTLFQMVIEGMHRGIGLERVAIALIQGRKLKAKYVLGEHTEHWRSQFLFDIGPYSESIFTHACENPLPKWYDADKVANQKNLYPDDVVRVLGRIPSVISVLQIEQRKAAMFYADRWTFGGKITTDQFESFKHFSNQAQLSLTMMRRK